MSDKTITIDGKQIVLNIVRPAGVKGILPGFIFVHGGGWVLGDFQTHERLVRDLVSDSGAVAIFVNYTPSPEARYPVAINEIYAATQWVAEHGAQINVDGQRLAIVGNSVGGNMATVVAQMAKEKAHQRYAHKCCSGQSPIPTLRTPLTTNSQTATSLQKHDEMVLGCLYH